MVVAEGIGWNLTGFFDDPVWRGWGVLQEQLGGDHRHPAIEEFLYCGE
jgi:hypothetical protein